MARPSDLDLRPQKHPRQLDRLDQAHALDLGAGRQGGEQAGRGGGVQHDENALVVAAPDQSTEGLGDTGAGQGVVITPPLV